LRRSADNYLGGGLPLPSILTLIRQTYPITMHGLGFRLVQQIPLNWTICIRLKKAWPPASKPVLYRVRPSGLGFDGGHYFNDLARFPAWPYNEPAVGTTW